MEGAPQVCIIGAGLSGLCMAVKLRTELALESFIIFEALTDVGGTWLTNTYPGCASDIPSHLYSFSFFPKFDWSQIYSPQPEILAYAKEVATAFDIYPHIRFQSRVESLRWSNERKTWSATVLNLREGRLETLEFDIVINSTGTLRAPNFPPEYMNFSGPIMHSARWDHSVNIEGKRVGVIGTGASAVQIITAIADKVSELTVFQRQPPYIIPRIQGSYPTLLKWAYAHLPFLYKVSRASIFGILELTHAAMEHNSFASKVCQGFASFVRNVQVWNFTLRRKLTPKYPFGCKRVILSESYYNKVQLPHVKLDNTKITGIDGKVVHTVDQDYELDILILATGYKPHDFFSPLKIYGKNGADILQRWKINRPRSYLGICTRDMPNLFTLLGPYTVVGHNSKIFAIECQVHWTILAIKEMLHKGGKCVQVTQNAEDEFMSFIDNQLVSTVWANAECGSWYLDPKGRNATLWPQNLLRFWNLCRNLDSSVLEYI